MLDACSSFYGNFVVEHNRTALCIYPLHLHQSAAQVFKAPFCTRRKSFQAVSVWTDMSVLVELSDASASHLAREKKVILERARLMCDADVCTGLVRVQNIAYEKHVVVRYIHVERLGEFLRSECGVGRERLGERPPRNGQISLQHPAADRGPHAPCPFRRQLRRGGDQLLGQQRDDELRAGGQEIVESSRVVGRKIASTEPSTGHLQHSIALLVAQIVF